MSSISVNKRRVLSEQDGEATLTSGKRAALSDSDDDEDRLRQERMREVMQQTQSMQPTAQPPQSASATTNVDAPCTHSCPHCCPLTSTTARRVTFPFHEGEWLLRPIGGRVAHARTSHTAFHTQPPAALPTSYDSSIATVARSRLHAYLSKQVDFDAHIWPDNSEKSRQSDAEDTMEWSALLAGTLHRSVQQSDNTQQSAVAAEGEAAEEDSAALTSRERRKLKRKQDRKASTATATQPSSDNNVT